MDAGVGSPIIEAENLWLIEVLLLQRDSLLLPPMNPSSKLYLGQAGPREMGALSQRSGTFHQVQHVAPPFSHDANRSCNISAGIEDRSL